MACRGHSRVPEDHSLDAALGELFRVDEMARAHNDEPDAYMCLPQWAFVQIADLVNKGLATPPKN